MLRASNWATHRSEPEKRPADRCDPHEIAAVVLKSAHNIPMFATHYDHGKLRPARTAAPGSPPTGQQEGAIVSDRWYLGNAEVDGRDTRGWILGHFLSPAGGVRSSRDVEIKWGIHKAGETRPEWTQGDNRTTAVILIDGGFHIALTEGEALLREKGDYVVWGPGTDHSWTALTDSTVLTVRWPSTPPPVSA